MKAPGRDAVPTTVLRWRANYAKFPFSTAVSPSDDRRFTMNGHMGLFAARLAHRSGTFAPALALVLASVPMSAQNPQALDHPIQAGFRVDNPRSLHACGGVRSVDQIARAANVLVRFENVQACGPGPRSLYVGSDNDDL